MSEYRISLLPENDRTNGWAAHLPPRVPRPHLTGDVRADWLVIGAGWAGLAAARRLAENRPSDRIVVIDAAAAADGASGRNSGFAIDLPHTSGGATDENRGALGHMRLARAGIAHLKEQIETHRIDCDWREKGKYQAAVTDRGVAEGTIAGILAADLACGRDNPLLADMEALGKPSPLPPTPALGLGVRARLAWELWRWRCEA